MLILEIAPVQHLTAEKIIGYEFPELERFGSRSWTLKDGYQYPNGNAVGDHHSQVAILTEIREILDQMYSIQSTIVHM